MRILFCFFLLVSSFELSAQQNLIYYPTGLLKYNYELKEGSLHGTFISYYDNGLVKAKGSFTNNQKTGIWQAWDTSGMLRSKRYYRDDKDFDLLSEWVSNGCRLDSAQLRSRNDRLRERPGFHDETMFAQRYWKILSPRPANQELFNDDFINALKTEIEQGRVMAFNEERFINPLKPVDALAIVNRKPDEYFLKEEHLYSSTSQRMLIRSIGLGLVYKVAGENKIAWLYCPDLFATLQSLSGVPAAVGVKLRNNEFLSKMDMTTFGSPGFKPRKVEENESITITLAGIDYETSAWIYLLNREMLAGR